MKIEKLNDNQIRCILNKSDLDQRDLQLSELAYGSSKAKELFRDMMEQAALEFDFETGDNIPLMIEAIPVSPECLILIVTKVEDPEELDTRFSRFSSMSEDADDIEDLMDLGMEASEIEFEEENVPFEPTLGTDEVDEEVVHFSSESAQENTQQSDGIFDIMGPFNQAIARAKEELLKKKAAAEQVKDLSDEIYVFDSLDSVIEACGPLSGFYTGDSILYKDPVEQDYYMILLHDDTDKNLYERACNICSDHGNAIAASYATPAYFKEHFQLICPSHAVQTLSQLS